ncbi:hypothetical protein [Mycobacterium sp.]|uniref:hypothetical protein n=1 Tax=Mycobacterium sp. TaxID=1785 RepID=UPI0026374284|nr:hypothetical protein [Mycobacterium sp.]
MTQVETLAKYAARASFADLSAESRRQLPIHNLDSLGCCVAALGADPAPACREQVAEGGSQEIKDAVRSLENIQVTDLMELLGRVKAAAAWSERDSSGKTEEEAPCPACPVGW